MYKLKRVGLTALVGTLVTLSAAQAGGVSVGGTIEMTYTTLDQDEVTGNPFGTKKNITFSGGGEFANGWTYGIMHTQNDGMSGLSSSSMNINMGGIATLAYDSGTGSYGANTVDNVIPTAWEEVDYGVSANITDIGQVSKTKGVVNFTIKAPGSGTALSYSYANRMGADHSSDGSTSSTPNGPGKRGHDMYLDVVNIDTTWFGWRLGAAAEKVSHPVNCDNLLSEPILHGCTSQAEDEWGGTTYTTLRLGPFSAGYQQAYIDNGDGSTSGIAYNHTKAWGGAFTVGDYLSFSYQKGLDRKRYNDAGRENFPDPEWKDSANPLETITNEFVGGSAAANWGPLSLKYVFNKVTNNVTQGDRVRDQHQEINLSMAF